MRSTVQVICSGAATACPGPLWAAFVVHGRLAGLRQSEPLTSAEKRYGCYERVGLRGWHEPESALTSNAQHMPKPCSWWFGLAEWVGLDTNRGVSAGQNQPGPLLVPCSWTVARLLVAWLHHLTNRCACPTAIGNVISCGCIFNHGDGGKVGIGWIKKRIAVVSRLIRVTRSILNRRRGPRRSGQFGQTIDEGPSLAIEDGWREIGSGRLGF